MGKQVVERRVLQVYKGMLNGLEERRRTLQQEWVLRKESYTRDNKAVPD